MFVMQNHIDMYMYILWAWSIRALMQIVRLIFKQP